MACPVCGGGDVRPFATVAARRYRRCGTCAATFLDPAQRPDAATEHAHYATHENAAADPGYRRFAARLADPLAARLAPGARVLDFGCGASSALGALLAEAGFDVHGYDPLFAPDPGPLAGRYDAVAACEVVEHLHAPGATFAQLATLVRPGGWLAVMTCFQTDDARFAGWWYRRDPTHVVFYRAATFHHVAAQLGWACAIPRKDVALLQRPAAA
ncbi:MAG: class I SAM-dependent methyltransferase [Alphaproteobacteria bacterium]